MRFRIHRDRIDRSSFECDFSTGLALTLLVTGIRRTNHISASLAPYDLATFANPLDARPNLHVPHTFRTMPVS